MGAVNKVNGTAFEDNWRPLMLKTDGDVTQTVSHISTTTQGIKDQNRALKKSQYA